MSYSWQYRRFLYRLGYYDYQHGLIYRRLGQEEGWDNHLERCRNFILRYVERYGPRTITVLGSGWLLDFPVAELSEMNIQITLIDIIHPPELVKQVSALGNIRLIEDDVTGGLVAELSGRSPGFPFFRKMKGINDIEIPRFSLRSDPGMVVSLNILSQLDVLPVKYLKKISSAGETEFNEFRKEIQQKHLDFLAEHNSVLISDIEEIITDESGEQAAVKTVIADLPDAAEKEEWTWDFDLKKSDYYTKRSVMKVVAISTGYEKGRT